MRPLTRCSAAAGALVVLALWFTHAGVKAQSRGVPVSVSNAPMEEHAGPQPPDTLTFDGYAGAVDTVQVRTSER